MTTVAAAADASRRARSRRGEGGQLRAEILAAAEELLLATGSSEAVSIRAVADAVGVTPPSIYRHFADKTELIFAVVDRLCGELDLRMAEATAGIDDPVEALEAIGLAYVRFGLDRPEPYRIMFMSRSDETPAEFQDERLGHVLAFERAIRWTQAAIDAGRLRPGLTDARRAATIFWAHAHGLTSLLIAKPHFPWPADDAFLGEYALAPLRGLLADGEADGRADDQASAGSADQSRSGER
ncbi:MAG TPA: TetR/AcrR family transcriptional regulator [Acidimicrobiales bacterium]